MKLDYVRQCIEANKHNSITTGYYLLLKKHLQNGGILAIESFSIPVQPSKIRSLSISIPNEFQPPLFRLTYDKIFKPIYPSRAESVHNKTVSVSSTPLREKYAKSVLENKAKNSHQRTTSQVVGQNVGKRVISLSPQRENIKPDNKKPPNRVRNIHSIDTGVKKGNKSMSTSFKTTPRSATSKDKSRSSKIVREIFLSK